MERLLQLMGQAMAENNPGGEPIWFIHFNGRVNIIELSYFPDGWAGNPVGSGYILDAPGIAKACEFFEQRLKNVPQS